MLFSVMISCMCAIEIHWFPVGKAWMRVFLWIWASYTPCGAVYSMKLCDVIDFPSDSNVSRFSMIGEVGWRVTRLDKSDLSNAECAGRSLDIT